MRRWNDCQICVGDTTPHLRSIATQPNAMHQSYHLINIIQQLIRDYILPICGDDVMMNDYPYLCYKY